MERAHHVDVIGQTGRHPVTGADPEGGQRVGRRLTLPVQLGIGPTARDRHQRLPVRRLVQQRGQDLGDVPGPQGSAHPLTL